MPQRDFNLRVGCPLLFKKDAQFANSKASGSIGFTRLETVLDLCRTAAEISLRMLHTSQELAKGLIHNSR